VNAVPVLRLPEALRDRPIVLEGEPYLVASCEIDTVTEHLAMELAMPGRIRRLSIPFEVVEALSELVPPEYEVVS
jgi:hypothetical protein